MPMAARPYPAHLASTWQSPDGRSVTIRPIRPDDAGIEREFVKALTPEARYMRFMSTLKELTPEMIAHFTQVDFDREMALIGVVPHDDGERLVGVCRYVVAPGDDYCEFALVVAEAWLRRGLGRHLMERLIAIARGRGLGQMRGEILSSNVAMLDLASKLGFVGADAPGVPGVRAVTLALQPAPAG